MFSMGVFKLYLMTLLCVVFVKAQINTDYTNDYRVSPSVQDVNSMFSGVLFYTSSGFQLMVTSTRVSGLKSPSSVSATKSSQKAKKSTLFVTFAQLTVDGFVGVRGSTKSSTVQLVITNVRYTGIRDDTKKTVTGSIIGVDQTNVGVPPCKAPPNPPKGLNTAVTCGGLFNYINISNKGDFLKSQIIIQAAASISSQLNEYFNNIPPM